MVKRKGEEQGGEGSRWRQTQGGGEGERQALGLLMAVPCGKQTSFLRVPKSRAWFLMLSFSFSLLATTSIR